MNEPVLADGNLNHPGRINFIIANGHGERTERHPITGRHGCQFDCIDFCKFRRGFSELGFRSDDPAIDRNLIVVEHNIAVGTVIVIVAVIPRAAGKVRHARTPAGLIPPIRPGVVIEPRRISPAANQTNPADTDERPADPPVIVEAVAIAIGIPVLANGIRLR
jgi:hypothetical protein